jgi:hypothetical protein
MPIKLKYIPATESNPLEKHLNNISAPFKERMEYAEKRLKAVSDARNLIKKNTDTGEKISKHSDPIKTTEDKDKLNALAAAIDKAVQVNQETGQTIHEYLANLDNLRKENQLIYRKRLGEPNLSLGFGVADTSDELKIPYYRKKLLSTNSFTYYVEQHSKQMGAAEFAITYDNKIFIVPKSEGIAANNLYRMTQGTLLKAVGCIQIGNRKIIGSTIEDGVSSQSILEGQVNYISAYNTFFDAQKDNIVVSLFALQRLGIDLSETKVVIPHDNAPLITHTHPDCRIAIHGEIKNASYYLNENRFPGAKTLATEKLSILYKIGELFCSIDDAVLSKRNKSFIKKIYGEKELLKLNMAKLFSCIEESVQDNQKTSKAKTEASSQQAVNLPTTSLQAVADQNNGDTPIISSDSDIEELTATFNDYWQVIKTTIQFFKEKNIDLTFLPHEINMVLAYILQNGLNTEEKNQLEEWAISLTTLSNSGTLSNSETILGHRPVPGRSLDRENISSFISFYQNDPMQTCFNLFKDYSKGDGWQGIICRFFSGAWNRNYKDPVNKVLSAYYKNELPDNLTICGIYENLKDSGLRFNFDAESKSSLRKILLFCAKLNNEEETLLHLIRNLSFTAFPPLDSDRQIDCCC